jgi:threonine/homoserine/homoserine lactone efflux protein
MAGRLMSNSAAMDPTVRASRCSIVRISRRTGSAIAPTTSTAQKRNRSVTRLPVGSPSSHDSWGRRGPIREWHRDVTTLLAVLPLAIVMIAGPQIISAVLLATSENPRRSSVAFLTGVTLAILLGITITYTLARLVVTGSDTSSRDDTKDVIDYVVIGLLVIVAIRVYLHREHTEPPKWMTRLQEATPWFSFRLGFLLFLLMPTDILMMITVGSYLARHDMAWWECLPFVALTLLLAATPLLVLLLMGQRAGVLLPRMRQWMTDNSWVVSEVVILFFLVLNLT